MTRSSGDRLEPSYRACPPRVKTSWVSFGAGPQFEFLYSASARLSRVVKSSEYFELLEVDHDQTPTILVDKYIPTVTPDVVIRDRRDHNTTLTTAIVQIVIFRNVRGILIVASNDSKSAHPITFRNPLSSSH